MGQVQIAAYDTSLKQIKMGICYPRCSRVPNHSPVRPSSATRQTLPSLFPLAEESRAQ